MLRSEQMTKKERGGGGGGGGGGGLCFPDKMSKVGFERNPCSYSLPPGDEWLSNPKHHDCSLVQVNKHTIVDLSQSQQL